MNEPVETDGVPPSGTAAGNNRPSLSDRVRSLRLPDERPEQPAAWSSWLAWGLCALLACSTGVFAWLAFAGSSGQAQTPKGETAQGKRPIITDPTAPPAPPGTVVLESKGYIVPVHQIQVSPKVGGMVVKLNPENFPRGEGGIKEGRLVKKGEILAVLETIDYEADRNRARGQLDAAWQRFLELYTGYRSEEIKQTRAELDEARATREQLYLDWKRSASMSRTALPQREFEQIESSYKAADRRLARMESAYALMIEGPRQERIQHAWAEIEQAAADLTKAQWRLDNCIVRAPISGTILTKKAEEGNIVNPVAFNVSASLCEMADLSDLEVDLNIQERDIANVFEGQQCRIRPEAFPKREYSGVVSRLMPIADRAKGAIPVRVKVDVPKDEAGKFLKPEMSVLVSFLSK
jgi:multidrug resistance efflux pump